MITYLALAMICAATFIGATGSVFLKKGAAKFNLNAIKQLQNKELILGIFCSLLGAAMYIPALRMANLSIVYPTTSLSYVWAVILGNKMLGEAITKEKIMGVGLIIIGILVLAAF